MREKGGERKKQERKKRKREGGGFSGVEERRYRGGQDLILITLDRHDCFSVFHHLQKDKQRKQRHSLKLGKKRRESSKRNCNITSPTVIIKAIIIIIITTEGLTKCLDPERRQNITSVECNFLKKQERWEGQKLALITTVSTTGKETKQTDELEEAGYKSPWHQREQFCKHCSRSMVPRELKERQRCLHLLSFSRRDREIYSSGEKAKDQR